MIDTIGIINSDVSLCTGCMACVDVCPAKAISENFTEDGFRIPVVCEEKCIHCNKCDNVCSIGKEKNTILPISVYRMSAKDDAIRMKCSSGGIFALLAEHTIKGGGIVIGAAFNAERKDICHTTTNECNLEEILRSKYVQSDTTGIYKKTEQFLREGQSVLFCGTPCQVRALHTFLVGKKYTGELLTVDFMCHGVPSTMEFKDFISERERIEKSPVINVTFREKDKGWRKQIIKAYHKNGTIWKRTSYYYYYYYLFLSNYSLRDSCYFCEEYHAHVADITLADDWDGSDNDNIGTSRVFINTLRGKKIVAAISEKVRSSDITAIGISTLDIYCHSGYDYRKKELWKSTLRSGGYEKAKREFFFKVSVIPIVKEKIWRLILEMKKIVKILGGKE